MPEIIVVIPQEFKIYAPAVKLTLEDAVRRSLGDNWNVKVSFSAPVVDWTDFPCVVGKAAPAEPPEPSEPACECRLTGDAADAGECPAHARKEDAPF